MRERAVRAWSAVRRIALGTVRAFVANDLTQAAAALSYWLLVTAAPLALALYWLTRALSGIGAGFAAAATDAAQPVGPAEVAAISGLLESAQSWASSYARPVVAVVIVLVGATGVFSQFALTVTRIWGHGRRWHPALTWIAHRIVGLVLLLAFAVLLVFTSVADAAITSLEAAVGVYAGDLEIPLLDALLAFNWHSLLSFAAFGLLVTVALMIVPTPRPKLRDVVPGAVLTTVAYVIGDACLGWYFSYTTRFEAFGAFGAFVAFLVWAYYNSMIVLTGAAVVHETVVLRHEREDAAQAPMSGDI